MQNKIEFLQSEIAQLEKRRAELSGNRDGALVASRGARSALIAGTGDAEGVQSAQGYADALTGALGDLDGALNEAQSQLAAATAAAATAARDERKAAICAEATQLSRDLNATFEAAREELRLRVDFLIDGRAHLAQLRRDLDSIGGRGVELFQFPYSHPFEPLAFGVAEATRLTENEREKASLPTPRAEPSSWETNYQLSEPAIAPPQRGRYSDERDEQRTAEYRARAMEKTQ